MQTRTLGIAALAAAAAVALAVPARSADDDAGKEIFLAQKCNLCHTVSSADIEATTSNDKLKGPDLSTTPRREEAMLKAFLRQEETLDGKKHKKKFSGSDEELKTLIDWLRSQAAEG